MQRHVRAQNVTAILILCLVLVEIPFRISDDIPNSFVIFLRIVVLVSVELIPITPERLPGTLVFMLAICRQLISVIVKSSNSSFLPANHNI